MRFSANKKPLLYADDRLFLKVYRNTAYENTNSKCVASAIKSIFARHGILDELISDGGPSFNSKCFKNSLWNGGVNHSITSPHFPRAIGQVKRAIQMFKNALIKAEEDGKDLYVIFLNYRTQSSNELLS